MSRYARKQDDTHRSIVAVLRASGCSVETIQGRAGTPDLVVGWGECVNELCEVKSGDKARHALHGAQVAWHLEWRGRPVVVLRCEADALDLVARLRGEAMRMGARR